ncbi:hypothetical protein J6590_002958 [Homalodisca vitripennis]|nr:hypothetical protein J6590_002958 [Homalodisca vitripennis]
MSGPVAIWVIGTGQGTAEYGPVDRKTRRYANTQLTAARIMSLSIARCVLYKRLITGRPHIARSKSKRWHFLISLDCGRQGHPRRRGEAVAAGVRGKVTCESPNCGRPVHSPWSNDHRDNSVDAENRSTRYRDNPGVADAVVVYRLARLLDNNCNITDEGILVEHCTLKRVCGSGGQTSTDYSPSSLHLIPGHGNCRGIETKFDPGCETPGHRQWRSMTLSRSLRLLPSRGVPCRGKSFLSHTIQTVQITNNLSSPVDLSYGVQGSILSPTFFWFYVNNIESSLSVRESRTHELQIVMLTRFQKSAAVDSVMSLYLGAVLFWDETYMNIKRQNIVLGDTERWFMNTYPHRQVSKLTSKALKTLLKRFLATTALYSVEFIDYSWEASNLEE